MKIIITQIILCLMRFDTHIIYFLKLFRWTTWEKLSNSNEHWFLSFWIDENKKEKMK
jgi:hypothetical protein